MLLALLKSMRPKQWIKNGFLFVALIFDEKLTDLASLLPILTGFAVFCLLASTVYLLNDLFDRDADRQHPTKRNRPLAAGTLSAATAWIAIVVLLLVALPIAFSLNLTFFLLSITYLLSNISYTRWLKHIPILDVLLLAGFYVVRVAAGVSLIEVTRFSPWLYVFTTFLALYLGVGKRRAELSLLAGDAANTRRVLGGYTLPFLDQLTIIVSAMAIITYSLYTFSAVNLPENHTMMLTVPFVIYGIFRYLYLVQVMQVGDAPTEVFYTDRPLQVCILLWGLTILTVFYLF